MVTANSMAAMEKRTRPIAVAGALVATVIANVPLPWVFFCRLTYRAAITTSRRLVLRFLQEIDISAVFGRGSWIRTNDLQYPKLISHISQRFLQLPHAAKTLCFLIFLAP